MTCPMCKKLKSVHVVKDAAFLLVRGKLKAIAGFWCDDCLVSWITKKEQTNVDK